MSTFYVFVSPRRTPIITTESDYGTRGMEQLELAGEYPTRPDLIGTELWRNGEWITPHIPEPGYRDRRVAAYPSVGDQLDAIWHAMDSGILSKVPEFYDPIKQVKDDNPK